MAIALGAQNKTRVKQEMMDVILFETRLANVSGNVRKLSNLSLLSCENLLIHVLILIDHFKHS